MCTHPVWGQECNTFRTDTTLGQRETREKQFRARNDMPMHPMCPKTTDEPVIVQVRGEAFIFPVLPYVPSRFARLFVKHM
jgi:hypothetical protein